MKTLLGGALASVLVAFATPAVAADLAQDPIAIDSVDANPTSALSYVPGVVGIAFQNDATSPATEVTFLVTDAQAHRTTISDVGRFSTGVTIRDNFQVDQIFDDATVQVVHVELADGSSWSAAPAM